MGAPMARARLELLGVPLDNLSMDEAVAAIVRLAQGDQPRQVCFVNADCVNIAARAPDYRRVLADAALVLADGAGVRIAGRALGTPIRDNVNGTDLFPRLLSALEGSGLGLFLLGARPGVTDDLAAWIHAHHPGVTLAGWHHGYLRADEIAPLCHQIRASGARVLLVALGVPRQEIFIHEHAAACGAPVALGVGGLFDFYSGRIPRAPAWIRARGLEWVYRLGQEPTRLWRRYLVGNWIFMGRVARALLRGERSDGGGAP